MKLTNFQRIMAKERREVIDRFQRKYKTVEAKEKALTAMNNSDIHFLIYCSDTIYANIFYSKFLKR